MRLMNNIQILLLSTFVPLAHLHAATDSWQTRLKTFKETEGVFVKHEYKEVEFWKGPCWTPNNTETTGTIQSNWSYNSEHAAFKLTVSGFPTGSVLGGGGYAVYDIDRRLFVQEVRSDYDGVGTVLVKYFRNQNGKIQIMALASTPEKNVYLCEFNTKKEEVYVPQDE
jgi:hypothetical protein